MRDTFLKSRKYHRHHTLHDDISRRTPISVPSHIGIIMDGNQRYSELHGKMGFPPGTSGRFGGHAEGVKALKRALHGNGLTDITNTRGLQLTCRFAGCMAKRVEVLSVYAFSTENWGRSSEEVDFLLRLFESSLIQESDELIAQDVRVSFIGGIHHSRIPKTLLKEMSRIERLTRDNRGLHLCVFIDYSSQADIANAVRSIAKMVKEGTIDPDHIDESLVAKHLSTSHLPPLDLIIRTSGEQRLSNFLLYEAAYAELIFMDQLWPEFTAEHLDQALSEYSRRKRTFVTRPAAVDAFIDKAIYGGLDQS